MKLSFFILSDLMAFSQATISQIQIQPNGADLFVTWASTSSPGTMYQVYVDHVLAWFGISLRCQVPTPADAQGRNVWIDVGTVESGEDRTDFSSDLASLAQGAGMAELLWSGSTYLDPSGAGDVSGFRIYQLATPTDNAVSSTPLVDVPAYPGGWISDGFGLGGFGQGGFGQSATAYSWSPGFLSEGTWQFSIIPYDSAGNSRGSGQTIGVVSTTPPLPPVMSQNGARLSYTLSDVGSGALILNWQASPSC